MWGDLANIRMPVHTAGSKGEAAKLRCTSDDRERLEIPDLGKAGGQVAEAGSKDQGEAK